MKKIETMDELQSRIRELNAEERELRTQLTEHAKNIAQSINLKNVVHHTMNELREDPALLKKIATVAGLLVINYFHKRVSQSGRKQNVLTTLLESVRPVKLTSLLKDAATGIYQFVSKRRNNSKESKAVIP
jgi:hypothetical protein